MGTKHGSGKFISLSQCSSASGYGLPVANLYVEKQVDPLLSIDDNMTSEVTGPVEPEQPATDE